MNDLRKYIALVEQGENQQHLDERGGMIDKFVSKLGKIPGMKDITSAAKGKVKAKDIYFKVRDSWIQHATHDNVNKKDSVALKSYLTDFLELPIDFVEKLPGLDKPKADLKVVLTSVANELAKHVAKIPRRGKPLGRVKKDDPQVKRSDLDPKVLSVFKNNLNGNTKNIISTAKAAQRKNKISELRNRPLALLGYLVLSDAGYLD